MARSRHWLVCFTALVVAGGLLSGCSKSDSDSKPPSREQMDEGSTESKPGKTAPGAATPGN